MKIEYNMGNANENQAKAAIKATSKFYKTLQKRSQEAKEHPEKLMPLKKPIGKPSKTTSHH